MNGVDGVVERGMQEQKLSKDIQKVETMKQPSRKHRKTVDWKIAGQSEQTSEQTAATWDIRTRSDARIGVNGWHPWPAPRSHLNQTSLQHDAVANHLQIAWLGGVPGFFVASTIVVGKKYPKPWRLESTHHPWQSQEWSWGDHGFPNQADRGPCPVGPVVHLASNKWPYLNQDESSAKKISQTSRFTSLDVICWGLCVNSHPHSAHSYQLLLGSFGGIGIGKTFGRRMYQKKNCTGIFVWFQCSKSPIKFTTMGPQNEIRYSTMVFRVFYSGKGLTHVHWLRWAPNIQHIFSNNKPCSKFSEEFSPIIQFSPRIITCSPIVSQFSSGNHRTKCAIFNKYIELPWITTGQLEKIQLMARSF